MYHIIKMAVLYGDGDRASKNKMACDDGINGASYNDRCMNGSFVRGVVFAAVFSYFSAGLPAFAAVQSGLIKGSGSVIFYLASNERRYAFPNEQTFRTWYRDFSSVRTVSDAELNRYTYGGNVTYRPGTRLLKRRGDSRVYTVGQGGMLRWMTTQSVARALYGQNWSRLVDELPDARVADYAFGDPIRSAREVPTPAALRQAVSTIEQNRRPRVAPPVSPSPAPSTTVSPPSGTSAILPSNPLNATPRSTAPAPTSSPTPSPPARTTAPVVWPGQVSRTPSATSPSSTQPSATAPLGTTLPTPSPAVDLSSYPGALRAVSASTTEQALRMAIQNARPGDVIRVSGSYSLSRQLWIEAKGTAANPIYIVAADGRGTARFTMSGSSDEGINIGNGARYLVIDGLLFNRAGNNIVHVQGNASYITLRNLILSDAGADGDVIKINQASHVIVEGSDLARPGRRLDATENAWQEVIDVLDSDDVVIRRNWIHDFGNLAGYVKGGSDGARIEDNVIDGQRAGSGGDPAWGIGGWTDSSISRNAAYESVRVAFAHNVVAHAAYGALGLYDALDTAIERNTFLNNNEVIVQARAGNGAEQATDGVRFSDNRIVDTRGSMPNVCEVHSHSLRNFTATNNIYWNNGAGVSAESDCGFVPGTESGARVENRNFVDVHPTNYEDAMALLTRFD